jgi:uncharacterized protein YjbI with pentapeptide repeats|tara:strand:+ start:993 stop:2825 length:1833 start_codon:yes stop_codon:yes gene_type:complete
LTSASLAGANLSGARLPEDIAKFAQLDHVTEISKHARNIFVVTVLACVFSWLVVATTTDAALLVNKTSTELPFVGAKIPIAGFYWAAPAIMLSLYIYLLLYMQRLWESLADLPAVFPDGRPLEKQAFPWMLTSIIRIGVRQLRKHRLAYSGLRVLLSFLTGWLFVPATIIILWVRFLPMHEWPTTGAQIAFFTIAIVAGIAFGFRAARTLKGGTSPGIGFEYFLRSPLSHLCAVVAVAVPFLAWVVSDGAINGHPEEAAESFESGTFDQRSLVPRIVDAFLDLDDVEISLKPPSWTGEYEYLDIQIEQVEGALLQDRNLRFAEAQRAFFAGADLRTADMRYADFRGGNFSKAMMNDADLDGAILEYTVLSKTDLTAANLKSAKMKGAELEEAVLKGANLNNTSLKGAKLRKADLSDAELKFANLEEAILEDADLSGANFTGANLIGIEASVSHWGGDGKLPKPTKFERADLTGADLSDANLNGALFNFAFVNGTILQRASLSTVTFDEALFSAADLQFANLVDASFVRTTLVIVDFSNGNLSGANFSDAELTDVKFANSTLKGADFTRAEFDGIIDFQGAALEANQLDGACQIEGAEILPKHLSVPICQR